MKTLISATCIDVLVFQTKINKGLNGWKRDKRMHAGVATKCKMANKNLLNSSLWATKNFGNVFQSWVWGRTNMKQRRSDVTSGTRTMRGGGRKGRRENSKTKRRRCIFQTLSASRCTVTNVWLKIAQPWRDVTGKNVFLKSNTPAIALVFQATSKDDYMAHTNK